MKTSLLWITKCIGIDMQSYELRKTTQKRFFAESWLIKNSHVININNVATLNLCVEDINNTMEFAVVSIQYHYLRGISPHVCSVLYSIHKVYCLFQFQSAPLFQTCLQPLRDFIGYLSVFHLMCCYTQSIIITSCAERGYE